MRQAVTVAPRRIELGETADPGRPASGEALIEIEAVGLCGSDLHFYLGSDPYSVFPRRQGHEFAGRILELGAGTRSDLRPGLRVAVQPLLPCWACIACRRGRPNCCARLAVFGAHVDGALCERLVVPIDNLYPADDLAADLRAFAEPVSIGLQMVERASLRADDQAVVLGAGPIGQAVLLAGRDSGARFLAVDRIEERLELASLAGAEAVVDASTTDVADAVRTWTDGDGPIAVIEATGVIDVIRQAIDLVAPSGTVVVAGTPTEELTFPTMILVKKEMNLLGSRNNTGSYAQAVEIVRREQDVASRLISHHFPLDEVQSAIEFALANPRSANKVMIDIA